MKFYLCQTYICERMPLRHACVMLLLALTVVSCGQSSAPPRAKHYWIFQTSASSGDNFFALEKAWTDSLYTISSGHVHARLLPNNSIVRYSETLEAVGAGLIQGHITDPSYFSGKDPAFAMIGNMVGAWQSPEQLLDFIENGGGKELYNELLNPYGLQFIGASSTGLEAFLSSKPLNGLKDLRGLKLRAPEGMVHEVFAAAGASPVNLPGSEVYTALEKGVIDAADYSVLSTNHAQGMHRFAKFPVYPGFHSMPLVEISVNKQAWDALPDEVQQAINDSVAVFSRTLIDEIRRQDHITLSELMKDESVTVANWSQTERKAFQQLAKSQWQRWANRSPLAQHVYEAVSVYLESNADTSR